MTKEEKISLEQRLAAAETDALRRLRERDAAWAQIDGLRSVLDLKVGEGLGLEEMTGCIKAVNITGDAVARAEALRRVLDEVVAVLAAEQQENAELRERARQAEKRAERYKRVAARWGRSALAWGKERDVAQRVGYEECAAKVEQWCNANAGGDTWRRAVTSLLAHLRRAAPASDRNEPDWTTREQPPAWAKSIHGDYEWWSGETDEGARRAASYNMWETFDSIVALIEAQARQAEQERDEAREDAAQLKSATARLMDAIQAAWQAGYEEGLRKAGEVVCTACDEAESEGRDLAASALAHAAEAIAALAGAPPAPTPKGPEPDREVAKREVLRDKGPRCREVRGDDRCLRDADHEPGACVFDLDEPTEATPKGPEPADPPKCSWGAKCQDGWLEPDDGCGYEPCPECHPDTAAATKGGTPEPAGPFAVDQDQREQLFAAAERMEALAARLAAPEPPAAPLPEHVHRWAPGRATTNYQAACLDCDERWKPGAEPLFHWGEAKEIATRYWPPGYHSTREVVEAFTALGERIAAESRTPAPAAADPLPEPGSEAERWRLKYEGEVALRRSSDVGHAWEVAHLRKSWAQAVGLTFDERAMPSRKELEAATAKAIAAAPQGGPDR